MRVILASGSPRRKELLSTIIQNFEIIPSSAEDESDIKKIIKEPEQLVESLSEIKARDIFSKEHLKSESLTVIGGDTIVYLDGEILGKPKNEEDAFNMLSKLQGRENVVYTGLAVMIKREGEIREVICSNKSIVKFKNMTKEDILEYIDTKEPMDKAGGFAINELRC